MINGIPRPPYGWGASAVKDAEKLKTVDAICIPGPLPVVLHRRMAGEGRAIRGGLGQPGLLQLHHLCRGGHVRHLRHSDLQDQFLPLQGQGQQLLQCFRRCNLQCVYVRVS